jgi:hypothetical protein
MLGPGRFVLPVYRRVSMIDDMLHHVVCHQNTMRYTASDRDSRTWN